MIPVMQDAIKKFEKIYKFKYLVKYLLIIDPTSPLRNSSDIKKAIILFKKKNQIYLFQRMKLNTILILVF